MLKTKLKLCNKICKNNLYNFNLSSKVNIIVVHFFCESDFNRWRRGICFSPLKQFLLSIQSWCAILIWTFQFTKLWAEACLGNIFVTLILYLVIVYIVTRLSRLTYDLDLWTQVEIIKVVFAYFFAQFYYYYDLSIFRLRMYVIDYEWTDML
jgi:hypothetical protein